MSDNFRGVTFAEQAVTPADDAIVRRAILPDGILTGCEISYSGSTLTMAAGFIIACGRTFQHTTAQNWAVVDASSGYARLVLTIDLTKTATEDTFKQIDSAIEYASSEDGFVGLDQQDINLSGTRYQICAAVVSLGVGGITGIVSQLEKSRAEGGGLNFRLVGGLAQPNDPKKNDIWVNTPEKITGYYFSPVQPENMLPGEVWISIGTSSPVAFNAVKKNTVMVYPIGAKQMINGILVDKTAKSWQDGAWVEWIPAGSLFWHGDQRTEKTGGWTSADYTYYGSSYTIIAPTLGETIHLETNGGAQCAIAGTGSLIDLTGYQRLQASFEGRTGKGPLQMAVSKGRNLYAANTAAYVTSDESSGTIELDLSSVNDGKYYIGFSLTGGSQSPVNTATITEVVLLGG